MRYDQFGVSKDRVDVAPGENFNMAIRELRGAEGAPVSIHLQMMIVIKIFTYPIHTNMDTDLMFLLLIQNKNAEDKCSN